MSTEEPQQLFAPENIAHNNRIVNVCQTLVCSIAGVATGILSITGIYGFLVYFLAYLLATVLLLVKTEFKILKYFPATSSFWIDGLSPGFMSFILFWTYPSYYFLHLNIRFDSLKTILRYCTSVLIVK